jgi:catechol 2,3-dioxygenase-like lactoylglutathione lyase family enzyme
MRIDHVIYATADLDAAAQRIEDELGLVAVAGGRHDGMETHNRIVIPAPPRPPAAGGPGIAWIEVSGDAERLRTWLDGADLPVRVVDGAPAVRAIGIGERDLRGR